MMKDEFEIKIANLINHELAMLTKDYQPNQLAIAIDCD
jgi:hypothetical protein